MGKTLLALLALSAPAWADTVVVTPPAVRPEVHVEPAFPVQFEDLTVGYRHEELPDLSLDGFAARAVYGVPGWPVDGEGEFSAAWGYAGDNLVGHVLFSTGLRLVANKPGRVRPFVVAAPMLEVTRVGSDDTYAIGAGAGAGVDWIFAGPAMLSFDVRGAQTWDPKTSTWSGWQVLGTVSIGVHEEPR